MSAKIPGRFPGSNAKVLEQGEKIEQQLVTAKPDFQRLYPTVFPDAHFEHYSELLDLARSTPSDTLMRGKISIHTAAVKKIIVRFKKLHKRIIAAAKTAYPDDVTLQASFGVGRKTEICASPADLHTFLSDFALLWNQYGTFLLAAGCPPTMVTDIHDLAAELTAQKNLQGSAFDEREGETYNRVETLKEIWTMLLQFEEYAAIVYENDPARALQFKLYRGPKDKQTDETVPPPKPTPPKSESQDTEEAV